MKQLIKSQRIRIDDHSRGMAVGHFDDDDEKRFYLIRFQ